MEYLENKALVVKRSWVSITQHYTKFYCDAVTVHSNWMWTALNSLFHTETVLKTFTIHFQCLRSLLRTGNIEAMLIWHKEIFPRARTWVSLVSWFPNYSGNHNPILSREWGCAQPNTDTVKLCKVPFFRLCREAVYRMCCSKTLSLCSLFQLGTEEGAGPFWPEICCLQTKLNTNFTAEVFPPNTWPFFPSGNGG